MAAGLRAWTARFDRVGSRIEQGIALYVHLAPRRGTRDELRGLRATCLSHFTAKGQGGEGTGKSSDGPTEEDACLSTLDAFELPLLTPNGLIDQDLRLEPGLQAGVEITSACSALVRKLGLCYF